MDTGELGESIIRKWVAQTGLVANKVGNDKDGWDFLIAFPLEINTGLKSLDFDDSQLRCLLQVKTTTLDKKTESIKLTNLKRLVESKLPSFYIIIQVDEDGEPVEAFLYHVWEEIMNLTLEKLRKLDKNEWDKLNKKYIQLPTNSAEKFNELHGKELRSLLKNFIGDSGTEYVEDKIKLRKAVGYEDEYLKINFKTEVPEDYDGNPDEYFVDLALGVVDRASLEEYTIFDMRFGEPVEKEKNQGGYFSFNVEPAGKAIILLKSLDNRLSTQISTDYYLPKGVAKVVKEENLKIRYDAPYTDIFLMPEKRKINIKYELPEEDEECLLSDFRQVAELVTFLHQTKEEEIRLEFKHNGQDRFGISLIYPYEIQNEVVKEFEAVQAALAIKNYFKTEEEVKIKPIELYNQHGILKYLHTLLKPTNTPVRLEFGVKDRLEKFRKTIAVIPLNVVLGDKIYTFQIGIHGSPKQLSEKREGVQMYELNSSEVQFEQTGRLLRDNNEDLNEHHSKLHQKTIDRYDEEVMVLFLESNE